MACEEGFLCFPPSVFPPVVCSPASFHSGVGVQLRWGKASSGLGEYGSVVKVVARASQALATVVGGLVTAVLAGGVARGCSRGPGAPFPFRRLAGDRVKCQR